MHLLPDNKDNPATLTRSVIQITELLGLYRAETARVLNVRCEDIGALFDGTRTLLPGTKEWKQAGLFLDFYNLLFRKYSGDETSMCHWLRAQNALLGTTPLLKMVDEDAIDKVVALLEEQ